MKIDIEMGYKKEVGELDEKPYTTAKIDISKEELANTKKGHLELFEAIARLINFSIQFMQ